MDSATDGNLLARLILTMATLGYSLVMVRADFNKTHATNPLWTPHARFHVVWQVSSNAGVALIALALIWLGGPLPKERLYLAAALGLAVYGAFFVTVFARRMFGGALYDENGYLPFKPPIGSATWRWDANVTVFSALLAILLVGSAAIR